MTWRRTDLERVATTRMTQRERLAPVERAALAYARWQGMTDEAAVDPANAKAELDAALDVLDDLGPEGWAGLSRLADELGDAALIGLMRHSLTHGIAQLREAQRSIAPEREGDSARAAPASRPRKDKDR